MKEIQVDDVVRFVDWNGGRHVGTVNAILKDDFGYFYLVRVETDLASDDYEVEQIGGELVGSMWS